MKENGRGRRRDEKTKLWAIQGLNLAKMKVNEQY